MVTTATIVRTLPILHAAQSLCCLEPVYKIKTVGCALMAVSKDMGPLAQHARNLNNSLCL